jgi:KDO2-lipid IV(A) lauroyltransferase
MRERVEYATAVALLELLRALPLKISLRAGYGVTRLLDLALPKLRKVAAVNLAMALPELSLAQRKRIIDGVFRTVGRMLVALARFPLINSGNVREFISYRGLEHYQAAKQKGRGVLIATGHLGNWEFSAFAHALMTEPMHVMVRPLDNPLVDEMVEERRTMSGNHLIFKKDAARSVLKALKLNQPVGILIDQNTAQSEGVFIDFFGKAACAGVAFVKLAYHSQAPVIPGFALWDESTQRYVLHFLPEVPLSGDAAADTQKIHSILEEVIRQYPDQWMWIHRRWKTQPPGEASIY